MILGKKEREEKEIEEKKIWHTKHSVIDSENNTTTTE